MTVAKMASTPEEQEEKIREVSMTYLENAADRVANGTTIGVVILEVTTTGKINSSACYAASHTCAMIGGLQQQSYDSHMAIAQSSARKMH